MGKALLGQTGSTEIGRADAYLMPSDKDGKAAMAMSGPDVTLSSWEMAEKLVRHREGKRPAQGVVQVRTQSNEGSAVVEDRREASSCRKRVGAAGGDDPARLGWLRGSRQSVGRTRRCLRPASRRLLMCPNAETSQRRSERSIGERLW
jgi:hypothetical protein